MKQELFKVKFEKYDCMTYHDTNPIHSPYKISDILGGESATWLDDEDENHSRVPKKRKVRLNYIHKETFTTEEKYVENYGNPLARVMKTHAMVVVEKDENKVSLKLFWGFRERRAGCTWFKISRNVEYITVNTKTGDVYSGYLHNFQKKRKATKKIHKNSFINNPISSMKIKMRGVLPAFTNIHYQVIVGAIDCFISEIDNRQDYQDLAVESRLFKYYLDQKGIKYPNNFHLYGTELYGPKIRKTLKKNGGKLVDAFMKEHNLYGKRIKSALHNCSSLNLDVYRNARKLFGDDWINQDPNFILNCLNSENATTYRSIPAEFNNLISKDELKRVFGLFKKVYFEGMLDVYTFYDHIRMFTELKLYGETDLKWMSSDLETKDFFRQEHLDWTDKLQFYKRGHYERIYPDYTYELIQNPIDDFYPVVLNNSNNYNEESSIQSNCVKTYIGRPSSLIVSLRKGSQNSNERATIEYKITKDGDKIKCHRVQSLGRFNSKLDENWMVPLFKLDEYLLSYIKDKRFDTVKLTKKCANGSFLDSNSEWNSMGELKWSYKAIEGKQSIFDWI